ncbi:MAG: hypothetical protein GAK41_01469 [Burkholderia gladioli]|nr:MAG: hypothetical protein GAK41_01469 [Burkholderia gladioli]
MSFMVPITSPTTVAPCEAMRLASSVDSRASRA